ncbi:PPPDE putative peptidase domain-containing protein [Zopfochytrium polystomum]|nr:PPPDE putative peptidase domain-containing protein [Zopfochytrium polystomum]
MPSTVQLLLYDLSAGMARMLSQQLTGSLIEGIWHTSVVLYGREVYFGQGIQIDHPGATPHGHLVKTIDMGSTDIPEDVFWEYIEGLRGTWTAEKYHLFDNNCNSFTREVCLFLVGKPIPSYISDLPSEFLSTPFGRQIAPLIEGMFGPSRIAAEHREPVEVPSHTPSIWQLTDHPHAKIRTPTIDGLPMDPILFSQSSKLDAIFKKWVQFLTEKNMQAQNEGILEGIKVAIESSEPRLPSGWREFLDTCLINLPESNLFPLLDVLRLLVLKREICADLIRDSPSRIMSILFLLGPGRSNALPTLPSATHLMILRLACNLFGSASLISHCLSLHLTVAASSGPVPHRSIMTGLLIESLLSKDTQVKRTAASLAYNMSCQVWKLHTSHSKGQAENDVIVEEWVSELVAAVIKALEEPWNDDETVFRILAALGRFIKLSGDGVSNLALVLDATTIIRRQLNRLGGGVGELATRIQGVSEDICRILEFARE